MKRNRVSKAFMLAGGLVVLLATVGCTHTKSAYTGKPSPPGETLPRPLLEDSPSFTRVRTTMVQRDGTAR